MAWNRALGPGHCPVTAIRSKPLGGREGEGETIPNTGVALIRQTKALARTSDGGTRPSGSEFTLASDTFPANDYAEHVSVTIHLGFRDDITREATPCKQDPGRSGRHGDTRLHHAGRPILFVSISEYRSHSAPPFTQCRQTVLGTGFPYPRLNFLRDNRDRTPVDAILSDLSTERHMPVTTKCSFHVPN